jgi:hypothetical protein
MDIRPHEQVRRAREVDILHQRDSSLTRGAEELRRGSNPARSGASMRWLRQLQGQLDEPTASASASGEERPRATAARAALADRALGLMFSEALNQRKRVQP